MASGIERGDRVAVWAPNSLEWIVAALGVTTAGGVLVPVNTRFKGAEAAYVLARSGARLLFTVRGFLDTDYPALLASAGVPLPALEHTVLLAGDRRRRRDRLGRTSSRRGDAVSDAELDARVDVDRSPTTRATSCSPRARPGSPKGVVMTHGQTLRGLPRLVRLGRSATGRPLPDRQPVLPHLRLQGRRASRR